MSVVFRRVVSVAVLISLVLFPATSHVSANSSTQREFSRSELASLAKGGLVSRPMKQRRGSLDLLGGTSYQVINAPRDVVWKALLDTSHYHRMMPQVLEARLVKSDGTQRTVFMRQGAGPVAAEYYLRVKVYADRGDITFAIDEGKPHDLRAAWGFYTVRPYGDGTKTLLAYGVMADIGGGMLRAMMQSEVHDWMLKVPYTVKRFVEGSGRRLYKRAAPVSASAD